MEKPAFILGVDVSKNTLDIHCNEKNEHIQIKNNSEGFRKFARWCKSLGVNLNESIVVMEYTGGYEYKLIQYCEAKNIRLIRLPALEIKRSIGITRGKNDRVDARRIARYASEKHERLEPSRPLDERIIRLKELLGYRKRCVREKAGYQATVKERRHMYPDLKKDIIIRESEKKIALNEKVIVSIEREITHIIESNEAFKFNYELITSIKGIGKINGWMTIAFTENFTSFPDGRTYAVYVGVIPFDHSSGTSIRGRARVSKLANKWLKAELSQAAKSAMCHDKELREYAERKMETKPYGKVANNVKFKLILRMFAVVKRATKYVDNYQTAV